MTLAPPVTGVSEAQGRDHAECGSLACTSVLRTRYNVALPVIDNSSAGQLAAAVKKACPEAFTEVIAGNLATVAEAQLALGHYVVGLVHCTGQAVPCPPAQAVAAHWIPIYGGTGRSAMYYQVWTATHQTGADLFVDSDGNGPHLAIWFPAQSPTGVDMLPDERAALMAVQGAIFGPVPLNGGEGTGAPNNIDIIRRVVSPYASGYPVANPPAVASGGLTAEQATALAEIPALTATLARIEASLKGA